MHIFFNLSNDYGKPLVKYDAVLSCNGVKPLVPNLVSDFNPAADRAAWFSDSRTAACRFCPPGNDVLATAEIISFAPPVCQSVPTCPREFTKLYIIISEPAGT